MNTAKVYYDTEGNECSIHQMVKCEPHWAAHRIQEGEKAIAALEAKEKENADLKARVEELKTSLLNASADVPDMVKGIQYEKVSNTPTMGASTRLRDKHYRECEEILAGLIEEVKKEGASNEEVNGVRFSKFTIARAREGK